MTPLEGRVFDRLMRLYPSRYRAHYQGEMRTLFADQLRDARPRGRMAVVTVWAATIVDVLATAPVQHVRKEEAVAQPVDPVGLPTSPDRGRRGWLIVAASPLVLLIALPLVAPGFMDPLYANPPAILGLPAGILLIGVAIVLSVIGMVVIASARSDRVRAATILLLVAPAVGLILIGPAIILIIQNLAV